jgi:hypothetical protein
MDLHANPCGCLLSKDLIYFFGKSSRRRWFSSSENVLIPVEKLRARVRRFLRQERKRNEFELADPDGLWGCNSTPRSANALFNGRL